MNDSSNNPGPEEGRVITNPLWHTLKNAISKKPKPTIIESAGQYFEHFKDTEFCFLVTDRAKEHPKGTPSALDRNCKALKDWGLGFFRVVGTGRRNEADQKIEKPRPEWRVEGMGPLNESDQLPDLVEVNALVIYNALRGSGGSLLLFGEKMRELAKQNGISFMLHRRRTGPIKLADVATGKPVRIYRNFEEAVAQYFAIVEGKGFQLESIHRELSRPKGTFMMAHIIAGNIGEMTKLAEFTPARFSEEFELLTDKLHNEKVEMGFVSALDSATNNLAVLKEDATAMGMTWRELILTLYCPDTPDHGQVLGQPFLLVTTKDPRSDLRENLNEMAIKHRQDYVVFVRREIYIELVAPYHNTLIEGFTDLHAGIRAYAGTMLRNVQLPVVEVRIVS